MIDRNDLTGKLPVLIIALIVLAACQLSLAQKLEWVGAPFEEVLKVAKDGDAAAQFELGRKYDLGLGFQRTTRKQRSGTGRLLNKDT